MGKYIRKTKTSGDIAVRDASQTYLGVRTRAKTLALQRLQSSAAAAASAAVSSPPKIDYLELRSRRLEKTPLIRKLFQKSRKTPVAQETPQLENLAEEPSPEPAALQVFPAGGEDGRFEGMSGGSSEVGDSEIQPSLGENNLDLEARESSGTRESTPCSFIGPEQSVSIPGSSTGPRSPNSRAQIVGSDIPTAHELDEFFAEAERSHQRRFMEKYNFDIVNDLPLPGRYEWVKLLP